MSGIYKLHATKKIIMKKLLPIMIGSLILLSLSVFSKQAINDPLKIPLPVSPALLYSNDEGSMDVTSLLTLINYNINCTVENSTDNDPLYLIAKFLKFPENEGIDVNVDGMQSPTPNDAFIKKAGSHTVTFSIALWKDQTGLPGKLFFHNVSDGVITISNCYAMIGNKEQE